MSMAKVRILRWMYGNIRKASIRNEALSKKVEVASIENKLREGKLWCFRNLQNIPTYAPVQRSDFIHVEGMRKIEVNQKLHGWSFKEGFDISISCWKYNPKPSRIQEKDSCSQPQLVQDKGLVEI